MIIERYDISLLYITGKRISNDIKIDKLVWVREGLTGVSHYTNFSAPAEPQPISLSLLRLKIIFSFLTYRSY